MESHFLISAAFSSKQEKCGNNNALPRVEGEPSIGSSFVEYGLNNFEKFVTGQGAPYVIGAPAERKVLIGMIRRRKFSLESGEFLKSESAPTAKQSPAEGHPWTMPAKIK